MGVTPGVCEFESLTLVLEQKEQNTRHTLCIQSRDVFLSMRASTYLVEMSPELFWLGYRD